MKILKNRLIALLLCVLVMIGSTLLTTNIKLGREAEKVSDGFYKGVTYSDYKPPPLQSSSIISAARRTGLPPL